MQPTPDNALDRTIFEAIPIPTFVVDEEVRILDLNGSASAFCGQDRGQVYRRRGGHVLHCLHSTDVPEGCGKGPSCGSCVIRNSVKSSLDGQIVSRRRMNLQISAKDLHIQVTACPLPEGQEGRALLMVEDITHLSTLKNLIPICLKCKDVREDEEYWKTLESYVHEHMGVDFSHGLCPKCVNEFYPELRRKKPQALPES